MKLFDVWKTAVVFLSTANAIGFDRSPTYLERYMRRQQQHYNYHPIPDGGGWPLRTFISHPGGSDPDTGLPMKPFKTHLGSKEPIENAYRRVGGKGNVRLERSPSDETFGRKPEDEEYPHDQQRGIMNVRKIKKEPTFFRPPSPRTRSSGSSVDSGAQWSLKHPSTGMRTPFSEAQQQQKQQQEQQWLAKGGNDGQSVTRDERDKEADLMARLQLQSKQQKDPPRKGPSSLDSASTQRMGQKGKAPPIGKNSYPGYDPNLPGPSGQHSGEKSSLQNKGELSPQLSEGGTSRQHSGEVSQHAKRDVGSGRVPLQSLGNPRWGPTGG